MSIVRRSPAIVVLCGVLMLCLSGCAGKSSSAQPASSATTSTTIDNCGVVQDFSGHAPRRVITIKSTSTEMLLALGLGNKIIGSAFQDGPVPPRWSTVASGIPSISDKVPSEEAVLNPDPDFVYAGWESNFSADGAGNRADLQALGVKTYVSPSACQESNYQPKKLEFNDIFGEIAEVARIFHVDPAALISQQRAELATIKPVSGTHTALWFSSGSSIPYVGAGIGAPQLIMHTIGLTNIAAGIKNTWSSYSWEAVVNANPDVIVLVDATWNSAAKKVGILESNPATAQLDAVKNKRYLIIPFPASEAGVRTVSAAADLARQLEKLELG